ncbi:class I SAM-dependent methyltransferase [Piscirickettsia salmonis]|nr:class I SAM-dependent methyltransferase [Piscirickettsia salmonis]QHS30618.1 class I SAM-dependent methyltransferase [Piscirickettsia salmonis]
MEIAAGYGYISEKVYPFSKKLILNDLDERPLIKLKTRLYDDPKIFIISGNILESNIQDGSLDAIFCSRLIHFFNPDEVRVFFEKCYKWLDFNGKLFLTCETPYLKNWQSFIPVFEIKKSQGLEFPGYVTQVADYESLGYSDNLPEYMNFFDDDILKRVAEQFSFKVHECSFFSRQGFFPNEFTFDGRESVGLVAEKS